jgi:hypothetical protein
MADTHLTILSLTGLAGSGPVQRLEDSERTELVANLRRMAAKVALLSKFDLGQRLLVELEESMKKPLAEVLKEYWKQRAELRAIAAKKGSERDVTGEVELIDHSWTWKVRPSITVEVNKKPVHTLKLTVTTKLTLKGVELVMKNACITSVKAGTLKAETTLTYDDPGKESESSIAFQLLPAISRTVKLPGSLALPGEGLCLT